MEQEEKQDGFDLVLKQLLTLHEDASKSKDSNHRSGFDLVLRELMTQREKAAVRAAEHELMEERLKQKDEVALILAKQQEELQRERLGHQNELMLRLQKQQEEFQEEERRKKSVGRQSTH